MSATNHQLAFHVEGTPVLELRNHRGQIRCFADARPGEVTIDLRSNHAVDFGPVERRTDGDRVIVVVPPLSSPDGGPGFTLQLGSLSFASGSHGREIDIEVHVPARSAVQLTTGAGDLLVEGSLATVRGKTGTGDVRVADADTANLSTGTGDVHLERLGSGHVRSGTGDVTVASVSGELDLGTGVGDVHVGEASGSVTLSTGSGDVHAYLGSGRLEARTGAGDVHVRVPTDLAVWQDLSSGLGQASSRIDSHGEPTEGEPYLTVIARSGVGDVLLSH